MSLHNILWMVEIFLPYRLCRECCTAQKPVFHAQNFFRGAKWHSLLIILRTLSSLHEGLESQEIVNNHPSLFAKNSKIEENGTLIHNLCKRP